MDSFEWNKIIGAILGTLLFVMGIGFVAEAIYQPAAGEGPGHALPGGDELATPAGGEHVAEGEPPVEPEPAPGMDPAAFAGLLAAADVGAGEAESRICGACHDLTPAAANRVGPPLWNVVGRHLGSAPGYSYSPAMTQHGAEGETWTYEHIDAFLTSPAETVPGTKMGFGGLADADDRADLIVYLRTLSDNPPPLPGAGSPPSPPAADAGAMAPAEPEAAPAGPDIAAMVAAADASAGEADARICGACHDLTSAAGNRVGPALWGVVERQLGSVPGYAYSPAMVEHGQAGETWTLDRLDAFLTSPAETVPGTKMGFGGIADADDRADLLAYLSTLK
jgi:cytochrome c